ncbi:MAG: OmpA family protein [Myxococcota bacterium]
MQEAERWAATGPYGPQDLVGAEGRGGFTASYSPNNGPGVLQISQGAALAFKDTLVSSGGAISPHPDLPASAQLTTLATTLSAMPEPARSAALAAYQWTDAEKAPWITRCESQIESTWGGQHSFFLNQPQWDWIGADVNVDLQIGERVKGPTDHMDVETYKVPDGESLRTFDVSHQVAYGAGDNARDQSMRLASTTLGPKEYDLLRQVVQFDNNSSELTPAAQTSLRSFITTFDGAVGDARHQEIRLELVAHASARGADDYNLRLTEQRAAAVKTFLGDNGFHNVDTRVISTPVGERDADQTDPDKASDRSVELLVDGGGRMVTANHEWGHAFGLDDEYNTVGDRAGHDDLVKQMTDANGVNLPGAINEHNGGIMSYGNEVRPQHYATFHNALQTVTTKSPWSLGTRKPKAQAEAECVDPSSR